MNEKIKSFQSTHIFAGNLSFYVLSEDLQFLPPVLFLNQITRNRKLHIPNFYLQRILWEYDINNFAKQLHFVNIFYKRSINSIFSAKERLMFQEIVESSQQISFLLLFLPKYLQLKKFLVNLLCKKVPQQSNSELAPRNSQNVSIVNTNVS